MKDLPIELRVRAFRVVQGMKGGSTRTVDIFQRLREDGYPVKYETVRSWVTGFRDPTRKLNLVRKFDGNLIELIGMSVGDGSWSKILKGNSYYSARLDYGSKDFELAARAGNLMAKVLGKSTPYPPFWSKYSGVYVAKCSSKHLVELLDGGLKRFKPLISRYAVRFLKGIYNAEGSISVRERHGRVYPRVFLTNSDWEILRLARTLLRRLGIRTTLELNTRAGKRKEILGVSTATRVDVYNLCIGTREGFLTFARKIGFAIRRKAALLEATVCRLERNA